MSRPADLAARVEARAARAAVVGLGYVGLPLACQLARAGFETVGFDIRADRVEVINAGRCPIEGDEPGLSELLAEVVGSEQLRAVSDDAVLAAADLVFICVDTPVDADHVPRFRALEAACMAVGGRLRPGALVVVESTIQPGTMREVVQPALERSSGGRAGVDFWLGHCPERVMPGRLLRNMRSMSRVAGGFDPPTADLVKAVYATFVEADIDTTDLLTAELVKTVENAYRDVNIAFANQVALVCEAVGGDVWMVRELVRKSPGREMLLPGAGVGGHCIPKDPWLLASALGEADRATLLAASRHLNDAMPEHVADLVASVLREAGVDVAGARVAVLGYTYLEDSDDTRNSPSAGLVKALEGLGSEVVIHDPYLPEYAGPLLQAVRDADCAVLMVAHSQYRAADLRALAGALRTRTFVDGRGVNRPAGLRAAGFEAVRVLGIGSAGQRA